MARPLTLHLSALSDDEYTLYTSSLSEISSPPSSPSSSTPKDAYWEDRIVSLREARGWMRGRYGVEGTVIDTILKMFSPTLGPTDTLTSGQFFAAMRLVLYAQRGEQPERGLVFVQPPSQPVSHSQQHSSSSDRSGHSVAVAAAPGPATTPLAAPVSANPFHRGSTAADTLHRPPKPKVLDPFAASALSPTSSTSSHSGNPFVRDRDRHRSNGHALPTPATSPTPSHFPLPAVSLQHSPPLPPRKTAFPPPPQRTPTLASSSASGTGSIRLSSGPSAGAKSAPPPPPPKPPALASGTSGTAHHTSDLIHKSLHAARTFGVQKRAESELAGARMLEVIRSTTSVSTTPSPPHTGIELAHTSVSAPPSASGRRRAAPSPPTSVFASASETSSLERIATTRFPSRSPSPTIRRPPLPPPMLRSATAALPRSPFDSSRSPSDEDAPASPRPPPRTNRSQSVHTPPVSGNPPPIPRRPRPESLQLRQVSPDSSPFSSGPATALHPPTHPPLNGSSTLRRSVSSAASSSHRSSNSIGGTGSVRGEEFIGVLRDSFGALGLQARGRVHEARERLEATRDRVERRHTAKHGTRGETLGLRTDPIEPQMTGTTVDSEYDRDEERARSGWKPLV